MASSSSSSSSSLSTILSSVTSAVTFTPAGVVPRFPVTTVSVSTSTITVFVTPEPELEILVFQALTSPLSVAIIVGIYLFAVVALYYVVSAFLLAPVMGIPPSQGGHQQNLHGKLERQSDALPMTFEPEDSEDVDDVDEIFEELVSEASGDEQLAFNDFLAMVREKKTREKARAEVLMNKKIV